MDIRMLVPSAVLFLHDLFTVIWMGGMIVMLISYLPALKNALGPGPQVQQVVRSFLRLQGKWVAISIIGLIITGVMLGNRNPALTRPLAFDNPYVVWLFFKHILVVLMIAITIGRALLLRKNMIRPSQKSEKISFLLLAINAILAVVVIFASALLSTIG